MHEAGLMQTALNMAQDVARSNQADRIQRICLRVGQESGVVPEALFFAFDVIRGETMAADAVLQIVSVPGRDIELAQVEVSQR